MQEYLFGTFVILWFCYCFGAWKALLDEKNMKSESKAGGGIEQRKSWQVAWMMRCETCRKVDGRLPERRWFNFTRSIRGERRQAGSLWLKKQGFRCVHHTLVIIPLLSRRLCRILYCPNDFWFHTWKQPQSFLLAVKLNLADLLMNAQSIVWKLSLNFKDFYKVKWKCIHIYTHKPSWIRVGS